MYVNQPDFFWALIGQEIGSISIRNKMCFKKRVTGGGEVQEHGEKSVFFNLHHKEKT